MIKLIPIIKYLRSFVDLKLYYLQQLRKVVFFNFFLSKGKRTNWFIIRTITPTLNNQNISSLSNSDMYLLTSF